MGAKILEFQVCHIKNVHEGVLMQPALVRARRTNGEFKAFVGSPSPLAEGIGLNHFVGTYLTARAALGRPALEPSQLRKGWKTCDDLNFSFRIFQILGVQF